MLSILQLLNQEHQTNNVTFSLKFQQPTVTTVDSLYKYYVADSPRLKVQLMQATKHFMGLIYSCLQVI